MQQALPYRTWLPVSTDRSSALDDSPVGGLVDDGTSVEKKALENAVIVFGRRGCCMCHVVKRLLLGLGVNPAMYEVDEEDEVSVILELQRIGGGQGNDSKVQFPLVFIGGRLFGGLDRLMGTHISGELIPILKQAGALWL